MPPSARRTGARTAGRPRALRGGETGAVTAEYAVLLPVIAFVLVSVLLAGAGADTNEMVRVADDLKGPLQDLSTTGIQVNPTGASLLWSDFNEANLDAMLKSEMFSWPVTLAILVLAFGALVAAGLRAAGGHQGW